MQNKTIRCADASSENCPCWLAETGDCLICSRLSGKDECECEWTGVCIYNEFILNNKRRALPRAEETFDITERAELKEGGFTILKIACPRGFALKCLDLGTHIFIRPADREKYYDTPLSILAADCASGELTVCFRVVSAKTKALDQCRSSDKVIIRGPYRNGITGIPRRISGSKILLIASGAGVIPAVFTSNLLSRNNSVELTVNDSPAEKQLIRLYLSESSENCPDEIIFRNLSDINKNPVESSKLSHKIKTGRFDYIFILGSDYFIKNIRNTTENLSDAHIAVSNNAPMSCGEGICGACSCTSSDGKHIARCKCSGSYPISSR